MDSNNKLTRIKDGYFIGNLLYGYYIFLRSRE